MAKFTIVAFINTRHELEVEASSEEEARSIAERTDVEEWSEDMEYFEFDIVSITPA